MSESQKSPSVSFAIMATSSIPLGLREITIVATSAGMNAQKTFTLEVVE